METASIFYLGEKHGLQTHLIIILIKLVIIKYADVEIIFN